MRGLVGSGRLISFRSGGRRSLLAPVKQHSAAERE
jgi:hypothetical protein